MADKREYRVFYGYVVVGAGFVTLFLMLGTYNTFGIFLKPLAADLGWTRATVSGAYSLAFLLYGFLGIFAGKLTDKFGPKVVVIGCGVFLGLGYSLLSQLSSVWQFYLFYGIIVGAGMSGGDIPVLATVARWFVKRRGILTGIAKAGAGVGMFSVPLLAGWSISSYGWRNAYLIIAGLALVGIVSVAMLFKRDPEQLGQLPDGAAKVVETDSKVEIRQYSLREVTATRQFWIFSAIWFVIAFVTISILGHVAAHATDVGISTTTATTILSMIGGASVIGRVGMGGISDRLGNRKTLFITLLMLTAALVVIMFAREAWAFYLFALLQGISHGAAYTLISPLLAELFGLGSLGTILGLVVFIGTIGGAIGPILAGRTFDVTNGYQPFFLLSLGLSIAAIILLAFLKQTKMSNSD